MTPGIGHNNGPELAGMGWRRHCWGKARRALLPKLPIEIVRVRVKRAAEIGLDYRTYATVRASTGRDIVAFLFSTNALRLFRETQALEAARVEKLAAVQGCGRRGLAIAPVSAAMAMARAGEVLDSAHTAPPVHGAWSEAVAAMAAARGAGVPADGVLLVGETALERDRSVAGRLAGFLQADRFF